MCTETMGALAQNIASNNNGGLNYIQKIGLGSQAFGVAADAYSSIQATKAYKNYVYKQTETTLANFDYQARALKNRYDEEIKALADEKTAIYLQNLQAEATARTSAAGNGVEGSSIDSLMLGYERATAINNYMTDRELRAKGLQLNDDIDALRVNAVNSILGQTQYTDRTASTLLTGIGSLISNYSDSYMKSEYYKRNS